MSHAILYAILADGILSLMDAIIKSLTSRYPTFQIACLRFGFGVLWASALLGYIRPGWPSRETIAYNATRSVLVVITATTFFYALSALPLADAVALSFVAPVFIALFGAIFLKERLDARIAIALAAGLIGMVLIASGRVGGADYGPHTLYGVAACLISAVTYALALVLLRARATRDALSIIVWFQNLGPAVLLAIPAAVVWTTPSISDLGLFALVGGLGVIGHYLMANAFARAEAAKLAPIHYITLVWGVLFGFLFFQDIPSLTTLAGAAFIVLGTIATHKRQTSTRT